MQLGEDRRPRRLRRRRDHRAHAGDELGVDAVGLGLGAERLGEAPDAGGIELRKGQAGPVQRPLQGGMIAAGRLEGDAGDVAADPGDERPVPGGVVGDAAGLAARPAAGVEMVFRDVDADGRIGYLSGCPMLGPCEPCARVPVRVSGRTRGDPTLHRPIRGLQSCDPSPRRRRREPTLRRRSHPGPETPQATDKQSAHANRRGPKKKQCAHPRAHFGPQRRPRDASRAKGVPTTRADPLHAAGRWVRLTKTSSSFGSSVVTSLMVMPASWTVARIASGEV